MTQCVAAMTLAARNAAWSAQDDELPDGYIEAVAEEMADFAPCAAWHPGQGELHACLVHAADLTEEVDRRHFDLGLIGPAAWIDDHQLEGLWAAHQEARDPSE